MIKKKTCEWPDSCGKTNFPSPICFAQYRHSAFAIGYLFSILASTHVYIDTDSILEGKIESSAMPIQLLDAENKFNSIFCTNSFQLDR